MLKHGIQALQKLIEAAKPVDLKGFIMKSAGLFYVHDGNTPDTWICAPFQVLAEARDERNQDCSL